MPSAGKPGNDARQKKLELVSCLDNADRVESAGNFFLMSREQSGLPLPLLVSLQNFKFLCRTRSHLAQQKLKIDLFRCRKKKIFYPKKIFTVSEVTQRNFSWRNPRVVLKLIPCFGLSIFLILYIREELIFLRITYFVLPWIYTCSQRGGLGNQK